MNIEQILNERQKWFEWKNIKFIYEEIQKWKMENGVPKKLKDFLGCRGEWKIKIGDIIEIKGEENPKIEKLARMLMPWRKGPFKINDLFIDSEWKSYIKWNTIKRFLTLKDKDILDVGCNNGYHMFRMLEFFPKSITGFDPSALFNLQFEFINSFIKSNIEYKLLGVEHIPFYEKKFDVIFCMGVLYHRRDPIDMLKELKAGLKKEGEVILDTLTIEGSGEYVLSPMRYAKMKNVYFIPTIKALYNWIERAGFKEMEFIGKRYTNTHEQRKTDWIKGESLESFLNKSQTKTVEGYEPPLRIYLKLKN